MYEYSIYLCRLFNQIHLFSKCLHISLRDSRSFCTIFYICFNMATFPASFVRSPHLENSHSQEFVGIFLRQTLSPGFPCKCIFFWDFVRGWVGSCQRFLPTEAVTPRIFRGPFPTESFPGVGGGARYHNCFVRVALFISNNEGVRDATQCGRSHSQGLVVSTTRSRSSELTCWISDSFPQSKVCR